MPRPVSDAIADGLPLWDTYEALFFLVTGIFLGLVLGFLFPSAWRSFRRRFRSIDKYKPDRLSLSGQLKFSAKNQLLPFVGEDEPGQPPMDVDLVAVFVAARYAVQESAYRDAAALYLQILGSEKVSRMQTNKAMFELAQVYALSGLQERAIETGLELLHRKPAHAEVFKLLLSLCAQQPHLKTLSEVIAIYSGPKSGELSREVSHLLSSAALSLIRDAYQQDAVVLAKLAVRWSPSALEPKLALVEVTSVLHQRKPEFSVDQLVLGFFVDLAELLRLFRAHSNRSPFFNLPLFSSWSAFFEQNHEQVLEALERLKGELLAQLNWSQNAHDQTYRDDLNFLMSVLFSVGGEQMLELGWQRALSRILSVEIRLSNPWTAYICPNCSELQRRFRWKCPSCQHWETLAPWKPSSASV